MSKFDGESKPFWKLDEKFAQSLATIFWREGRRQLNQNDLKLRFERLDRVEKCLQFACAIAQPADVSDFARQFAAETKRCRGHFNPAAHGILGWYAIKGRIDFHCREIARVEFEPFGVGQL